MSVNSIFMVVASIACRWRRNGEQFILGPTHDSDDLTRCPLKLVNLLHFLSLLNHCKVSSVVEALVDV